MPLFSVLTLLFFHQSYAYASRSQFRKWYPEFNLTFEEIVRLNCTAEYDLYLHAEKNLSNIDNFSGGDWTNQLAQPVVACILRFTPEFIKANIGSAQVLLGLTPSMLAVLGPSTEETSLLSVVGRRPLLAILIAAGSPAVFPMRAFENNDPIGLLKDRQGRKPPPHLSARGVVAEMIFEYLIVIAAVANIATVSRDLGYQIVCSFAPHLTYLVLLWAFLILIIHGSGFITLFVRIHIRREKRYSVGILAWLRAQFTPLKDDGRVDLQVLSETYWFLFFSWFTAILTVCHNIYGTLVFSSMLFISVRDSIAIIGRYFASVIGCRMVLMYELASLRNFFNNDDADADVALEHVGLRS